MNEKIKTVLFSILVTAFFTFLVSGINAALKTRIDDNKKVAEQKVILNLLGLNPDEKPVPENEILPVFAARVEKADFPAKPELICYRLKEGNKDIYVIAFKGQGFWDNIHGFIAINAPGKTISGLAFTQHGETPGLGGRISEKQFMARFNNKPFANIRADGLRLKVVAEGSAKRDDEIDGITGATGTSSAVEKMINNTLTSFINLNQGGTSN